MFISTFRCVRKSYILPEKIIEILDFYHACEHLYKAAEAAFSANKKVTVQAEVAQVLII